MATATLGQRLTIVEREVAALKEQLGAGRGPKSIPWWEQHFGAFADSPEYEEASRLGREYRESLRGADGGNEAA